MPKYGRSDIWFEKLGFDQKRFAVGLKFLCLDSVQLRRCAVIFGVQPGTFLLHLLIRVYQPLLEENLHAPFVVAAHLAIGYALHPAERLRIWKEHSPIPIPALEVYIPALSAWLPEILQFSAQRASDRIGWIPLREFMRITLSELERSSSNSSQPRLEYGNGLYYPMPPELCRTTFALINVFQREKECLDGSRPEEKGDDELGQEYLKIREHCRTEISRYMMALTQHIRGGQDRTGTLRQAHTQQSREYAVRLYREKGGLLWQAGREPRRSLLDLHALGAYQVFGEFVSNPYLDHALTRLRKLTAEPVHQRRALPNALEGTAHRGPLPKILKWQLGLPENLFNERFVNHKLRYLQQISRQSQHLYVTLVVLLDASDTLYSPSNTGRRGISIVREVGAYFLQDLYQVLHTIPKLYADAFVFLCDEFGLRWWTGMLLSDGSGERAAGLPDDVFLQQRPTWLFTDEESYQVCGQDPSTYFQFLMPRPRPFLIDDRSIDKEQSIQEIVALLSQSRALRIEQSRARRSEQRRSEAEQKMSELLVTLRCTSAQSNLKGFLDSLEEQLSYSTIEYKHWICELFASTGARIRLWERYVSTPEVALENDLEEIQKQSATQDVRADSRSLRQMLSESVVESLLLVSNVG